MGWGWRFNLNKQWFDNKYLKYIDLCIIGDSTIEQRYEIIKETHKKAIKQMEEHKKRLELLEYKEQYYQNLMKNSGIK